MLFSGFTLAADGGRLAGIAVRRLNDKLSLSIDGTENQRVVTLVIAGQLLVVGQQNRLTCPQVPPEDSFPFFPGSAEVEGYSQ